MAVEVSENTTGMPEVKKSPYLDNIDVKDTFNEDEVPCLCSQRWTLSYLACFGAVVIYVLRINLSVAIVCMIKPDVTNSSTNGNLSLVDVTTIATNSSSSLIDVLHSPANDSNAYDDVEHGCSASPTTRQTEHRGELTWDRPTRSGLLALYFYGYICLQVVGGWLAGRLGGRRVFGVAMVIGTACTLVTPLAARSHVVLVYVLRFLVGFTAGVSFPALHSMWGRWAPPLERSKLMAVQFSGTSIGSILTFAVSGFLCAYGFDNGWGSIFYLSGLLGVLWCVLWFLLTSDYPDDHPRISKAERLFIKSSIGYTNPNKKLPIPWRAIFTSSAVWGCAVASACNTWTIYTLLTSLPTFLREVLHFNISENGLLSSVPYVCQTVAGLMAGQLADLVRSRKILNTRHTRLLIQGVSFCGMAIFLVPAGHVTCDNRYVTVGLLSAAMFFSGMSRAGYVVNHVDFAPRFAGILLGITNTAATLPGMIAPIVTGALTPNNTQEEWQRVFYLCGCLAVLGAVVFALTVRGEVQPWAREDLDPTTQYREAKKSKAKTNSETTHDPDFEMQSRSHEMEWEIGTTRL